MRPAVELALLSISIPTWIYGAALAKGSLAIFIAAIFPPYAWWVLFHWIAEL